MINDIKATKQKFLGPSKIESGIKVFADGIMYDRNDPDFVIEYRFTFRTEDQARRIAKRATSYVNEYDHLTMADILSILGEYPAYRDGIMGWDKSNFSVKIKQEGTDWFVIFPPVKRFVKALR